MITTNGLFHIKSTSGFVIIHFLADFISPFFSYIVITTSSVWLKKINRNADLVSVNFRKKEMVIENSHEK